MSDVEIIGKNMDRLLHSRTGPIGKWLQVEANITESFLEEEAQNVMRGFREFVEDPVIRAEAGELVAEIRARNQRPMEQRLSRKAEEERLNSWMGRGLMRRYRNVT